jgi:threonine/homoserine/homoserine lactone efflux protein
MTLSAFPTVAVLSLFIAISPGLAVLMSARTGMALACGIALGAVGWAMFGLCLLFEHAPFALTTIKLVGASCLFYMAWRMWREASQPLDADMEAPRYPHLESSGPRARIHTSPGQRPGFHVQDESRAEGLIHLDGWTGRQTHKEWNGPSALVELPVQVHGAMPHAGIVTGLWPSNPKIWVTGSMEARTPRTIGSAFRLGLFTECSHPKAAVMFSSLFVGTVPPGTNWAVIAALMVVVFLIEALWSTFVTRTFSLDAPRRPYLGLKTRIDRSFGGMQALLCLKTAIQR